MLRDDKPTIQFPNTWVSIGGVVEEGESYEEAIKREVFEELEIELKVLKLFKIFEWPEKLEALFYSRMDFDPKTINLHEGQMIKFMNKEEILSVNLGFHDLEIIKYFYTHPEMSDL